MTEWHVLDNPARASLLGPHARFAVGHGRAVRYRPDVPVSVTLPDEPDDQAWRDLAGLLVPGTVAAVSGLRSEPPAGWEIVSGREGVQLVGDGVAAAHDAAAVRLGDADVPEMLALVERTRPGPSAPRTIEMGTYLGIGHEGRLVAMAGERRLVLAVAAGVRERDETPFLHAAAGNVNAVRLHGSLGLPAAPQEQVPARPRSRRRVRRVTRRSSGPARRA